MAASVYAHSCFVRSAEIYFNLRILLRVFYVGYFIYICILPDLRIYIHDASFSSVICAVLHIAVLIAVAFVPKLSGSLRVLSRMVQG